jgi:hypothetical protein
MRTKLKRGDWVEVRSQEEILATLDDRGRIDGLPFMPEMLRFCGQRLRVASRADKTCDTIESYLSRRMRDTVHLAGAHCDGSSHGGCQAGCLTFWKESWLKNIREPAKAASQSVGAPEAAVSARSDLLEAAALVADAPDEMQRLYSCQATELRRASEPLSTWDVRQYAREVLSGNVGLLHLLRTCFFAAIRFSLGYGPGYRLKIWLYRQLQPILHGPKFMFETGTLKKTPHQTIGLRPGDRVRVKSYEEILATLDQRNKNRGLTFDSEMMQYCGTEQAVRSKVDRIVDERTGRLLALPNDCFILENVTCGAVCSPNRLFCPRALFPYWREIWLEKLGS